jgi:hypothetical protein
MPMSRKIAEELLPRLRQRYMGRGREGRSRLIDELCEQWGYSRKHAIKLLGKPVVRLIKLWLESPRDRQFIKTANAHRTGRFREIRPSVLRKLLRLRQSCSQQGFETNCLSPASLFSIAAAFSGISLARFFASSISTRAVAPSLVSASQ